MFLKLCFEKIKTINILTTLEDRQPFCTVHVKLELITSKIGRLKG